MAAREERQGLERHPLPQATLHTPLFAGVEAPVVGFEVGLLVVLVHATGQRLVPLLVAAGAVAAVHVALALATRKDRRLALVFSRSLRYPRYARPAATRRGSTVAAEPTFPRKPLP